MKRIGKTVVLILLCGIFFFSGFQLYAIYQDRKHSNQIFNDLKQEITKETQSPIKEENQSKENEEYEEQEFTIVQKLVEQNPDVIGWITIAGTHIDYPVMSSLGRPDYYLNRDFEGNYSSHGVPYIQDGCDVETPSDNITIYGHHMKDHTMFADLDQYKEESFYRAHNTIQFTTLTSCDTYKIIAVFKTVAYDSSGFPYYSFINANNQEEFDQYIKEVTERSFFDTGNTARYGDKLLTLSTCEYTQKNGRVVVVAKRCERSTISNSTK